MGTGNRPEQVAGLAPGLVPGQQRSTGEPELRVLLENGEYWLNNKGDLAILDISVRRIAERLPQARVGVLTSAPALLRAYEPHVDPICFQRGGSWARRGRGSGLSGRLGPELSGPVMNGWDVVTGLPARLARRVRGAPARRGTAGPPALARDGGTVPDAVATASMVVAIGGGYLTDIDRFQTSRTLALLELATDRGIPTAMTGQGIGPLRDPDLLDHAARVLPRVGLIALREGVRGPDLLRSLGVPDDRVVVTGDDAVELGYSTRRDALGHDIGLCLRVAEYSPVAAAGRTAVGRVVREFGAETRAGLVPLIVSEHESEDRRATMPLLDGYPDPVPPLGRFASARSLSTRVGRCRVVVTGAYHVAVFALSQGIPVVGLSTSRYYDDKFAGLAAMFGTGVELVRVDDDGLEDRLRDALQRQWTGAPQSRPALLERAEDQIAASRAVFDRICAGVGTWAGR
jgi:polysaccharide pyruvyl transferase WcaK-like protein